MIRVRACLAAVLCAACASLTGAAMPTTDDKPKADPPKPKKDEGPKAPFDQRVTFEHVDPKTGKAEDTQEAVDAVLKNGKWHIKRGNGKDHGTAISPRVGDRFTDKDGNVYTVTKVEREANGAMYMCEVKKKE